MAWCRMGGKPLFDPMMALFTDAYKRHSATMNSCKYSQNNSLSLFNNVEAILLSAETSPL